MNISKKLSLSVGALVAIAVGLGATSLVGLNNLGDRLHTVTELTIKKEKLANRMALDSSEMLSLARGIEVRGFLKDKPTIEQYNQAFAAQARDLEAAVTQIVPLLHVPSVIKAVGSLSESMGPARQHEGELYQASLAGKTDDSVRIFKVLVVVLKSQHEPIEEILRVQDLLLAEDSAGAASALSAARWLTCIFFLLTVLASVAVGYIIRLINRMLRGSVVELASASEQIALAALEVSSASQSMAQGASEQAATIEETSSASAEINSMAQRTTASSRETAEIVTRTQGDFASTNISLGEMVQSMQGINQSSQKISKIIKVIDEIAFQTNILALNAAVEAARAGEAGMGFAVVADEVRNLAQRCAQAAKDTTELIDDSIGKSNDGKAKVDQVAVAIRSVTGESAKIKILIDEISLGSVEQSRGIDQISRAITQMEQVTQSGAASAEQTAAAAQQLSAQAATMKDVVERLKQMVDRPSDSRDSSAIPSSANRRKAIASFKSVVSFAPAQRAAGLPIKRSAQRAVVAGPGPAPGYPKAEASFPMDDDFKEF